MYKEGETRRKKRDEVVGVTDFRRLRRVSVELSANVATLICQYRYIAIYYQAMFELGGTGIRTEILSNTRRTHKSKTVGQNTNVRGQRWTAAGRRSATIAWANAIP
jgi:ribosomal protein S8E